MAPLHSSLGNKSETPSQKKKKRKKERKKSEAWAVSLKHIVLQSPVAAGHEVYRAQSRPCCFKIHEQNAPIRGSLLGALKVVWLSGISA